MNITVFGGAQPKEGSQAYEEARELGALLAQRGHVILTGGYMGTMEAVSRGAHEAGAASTDEHHRPDTIDATWTTKFPQENTGRGRLMMSSGSPTSCRR